MGNNDKIGWRDHVVVIAIFAIIGLAALYWFVTFVEPAERTHLRPFSQDYSEAALTNILDANGFEQRLAEIMAAGTAQNERQVGRICGSPGFYRTEKLIREAFAAAGLEVKTQEFEVTVPVTEVCELLDEGGQPIEDVALYPYAPAGLLPIALPPEGIKARLVATEGTSLKFLVGVDPTNSIVLTYLDTSSEWLSLAGVGVKALLVREDQHSKVLQSSPDYPGPWSSLVAGTEVDFPRLVVRGPIERHVGREVTLRCKVTWQAKTARNIVGVLRAAAPRQEALIINSFYDSNSMVPDLAPGAEQAVSVAVMLEYIKALTPYRDSLQRDIIFIATAGHAQSLAGAAQVVEAIEPLSAQKPDYRTFEERRKEEEQRGRYAAHALELLERWAALPDDGQAVVTRAGWEAEDPGFREWFAEVFAPVAGDINLNRREDVLKAKMRHVRAGSPVFREGFDIVSASEEERKSAANTHPLLKIYLDAKQAENISANMMAMPFWELSSKREFRIWDYLSLARKRFQRLVEHHARKIRELNDLIAIRDILAPYARTMTLNLELYSGGVQTNCDLAVLVGIRMPGTVVEPQVTEVANTILAKVPRRDDEPIWRVVSWGPRDAEGSADLPNHHSQYAVDLESEPWFLCGRIAFSIVNYAFFPPKVCSPDDELNGLQMEALRRQIPVLGRAILAMGFGRVPFKTIAADVGRALGTFEGTVYTSAGSSSLVPTHPMTERTFVYAATADNFQNNPFATRGISLFPFLAVDPYGKYRRLLVFNLHVWATINVNAAVFDETGRVIFFKDKSLSSQGNYKNEKVPASGLGLNSALPPTRMNVSVFRCGTVAIYDLGNPKTFKSFKELNFLNRQGMAGPERLYSTTYLRFLEPGFRFYAGLMDGAADNPEILEYRAFMLNVDPEEPITPDEPEIYGKGYMVADTPLLALPHIDATESLLRVDEKRLRLQRRYGIADEQMLSFHARAREWLAEARRFLREHNPAQAAIAAGTGLAYAINNHPVIRDRIAQAVWGILWYLGLLVPFVFFAEKLLFGFADIRKQLLANAIIFLVVFALLRLFHPAFEMVRSSLVILLGFIILLLTLLVTMMVGGKFKQNIRELRGREGRVEGADVNRAGVIGTAFMLGLNNMRRRKVRTGLTCVTLVLITFVMICFTSVTSDLVNVEYPTGRSNWNGLMLRNPNYQPLDQSEIANIRRIYGERYPVTAWSWLIPSLSQWGGEWSGNPEIAIDREFAVDNVKAVKRAKLNGCIQMEWNEPLFTGLDRCLLTERRWFPRPPGTREERLAAMQQGYKDKAYVILPETAARELGITVEDVNTGQPTVNIRDQEYIVLGIIDSIELSKRIGLDGKSILPFDVSNLQSVGTKQGVKIIPEDVPHLNGALVMIVNRMPTTKGNEQAVAIACSILFPKEAIQLMPGAPPQPPAEYKEQRRVVLEYLERLGEPAYYAIDGVSYYGSRKRERTFAGLLELLVPIFIAALTVFNTMRGSVYERKDEIYVYNAVGIAPNHVFFIFMAEACVYAVVGAMMGYLLSQGTGRLLTALDLTGGMNMDYSSIATIYASLAIMGATLLSTIVPARDAARMASPTTMVSWAVPKVRGDILELNLPFTFTSHDRVAVISYFHRWLDANGAGSSGPFYCSPPVVTVLENKDEALVPQVGSTVWLKPYDLGVSQRIEIALPTDPETGEYIANIKIARLSGHVESWMRTVKPFLGTLRKQFLSWRVTSTDERRELYAEAKRLLNAVEAVGQAKET